MHHARTVGRGVTRILAFHVLRIERDAVEEAEAAHDDVGGADRAAHRQRGRNLIGDHRCAADEARHAGADDVAEMLECQDGVRPDGPDMTGKRPQHPQQRERIARPARRAIQRIGRLVEGIRFAEEEQIGDAVAARGQPGAEQPGDLLRTGVLGLRLREKHVRLPFAAV
jgi:hypothetical protein